MTDNRKKDTLKQLYYKINTEDEKTQNKYKPRNKQKKTSKAIKRLSIRYTEDEYEIIEKKTKEAGISKAAWIKRTSIGNVVKNVNPAFITDIVEMDNILTQATLDKNDKAKLLRIKFNELKDKFFAD